jgi:hypothetical protein
LFHDQSTDIYKPDRIHHIKQWPYSNTNSIDGATSEKVPSELAYTYDNNVTAPIWGFQIPENMPRLQFMKLALDKDGKRHLDSTLSANHRDRRLMDYPHHATPESALVDYLSALKRHIDKVLKIQIVDGFTDMTLAYVITVPAIWSEKAKFQTLECAEKTGFGKASEIQIISEPEAAAVHAMTVSNPHSLKVNDTIVICDAGGGTVDCITFTIVELQPRLRL